MTGYIYAVECNGRIKLGFSNYPENRFNKIASDAPFHCDLLGFWPGSRSDELAVHDKFKDIRVHGEWFASTESLLGFISSIAQPPGIAKRYAPIAGDGPLLAWRKSKRLTQDYLADLFKTDRTTILRWERGTTPIPVRRLGEVSQKTGIPRHELRPDIFQDSAHV